MAKWREIIPMDTDGLKYLEADELAREIEKCYDTYGIPIKIKKKDYDPRRGDGFEFKVRLKDKIHIEKVEKLLSTVQHKLELPGLQSMRKNGVLYFTTYSSPFESLSNNLKQVLASEEYQSVCSKMEIAHPVGVDDDGNVMIRDLKEYPHILVSGTTNSGKSTALKCLLVSLLQYPANYINLIIADRGGELTRFSNLPHLSCPIINKPEILARMFLCLHDEMERRNILWQENDPSFSKQPYIVCVIDEFQWFVEIINRRKGSEQIVKTINDILRYGRHAKIHLALAIHDPKDDIAIIDKSDLATQLIFQTVNSRKSSNAMGESGAEKLCGYGDMFFHYKSRRYHLKGVNMTDDEIELEVNNTKRNFLDVENPRGEYGFSVSDEDLQKKEEETSIGARFFSSGKGTISSTNEQELKFAQIVLWVLSQTSVSVNSIQKGCSVGNKNASEFYERLQYYHIIGDIVEKGRRAVLPRSIEEIPIELKEFLSRNDISEDNIATAISKRPPR